MQKHYSYLDIDLDNKNNYRRLNAMQGDIKSRYILVNLYSNNLAYDLSNCTVKIYGIKRDKTIFFNNAVIKNEKVGQFEIELTNQALAVAGELKIQILVLGTSGEKLTSSAFFIDVGESIIDENAIESTNEFGALTESLTKVNEWDSYFEETSGKIEEKYTERLNSVDSQIKEIEKKFTEVNVKYPPIPLVGAKGDGMTDDYEVIQNILNYCFNNDIMNIYIPEGTYIISKPLLLKTKRESSQVGWWDGKALSINGANKATTKIVKNTNNTLDGVHQEVNKVDGTIILFNGQNIDGLEGGEGTGINITNLFIENKSSSENSMAITGKANSRMKIDQINIKSYSGIILDRCFSSKFNNIIFNCIEKSLWLTNGTSNQFEHLYSLKVKNPYKIYSSYSSLDLVYGDNCTGIILDVGGYGTAVNTIGFESKLCQYYVKCDSKIKINSMLIHRQIGSDNLDLENCAIFYGKGEIQVDNLTILENDKVSTDSYLFSSESPDSGSYLDVGSITYYKNYKGDILNNKLKYCKQMSNSKSVGKVNVNGCSVSVRRNNFMPFVGLRGIANSLQTNFIDKAIYLDNESHLTNAKGEDLSWEQKYNVGDVLLINKPKHQNKLGYVVSDNSKSNYIKDCDFMEIPVVLRGTTDQRPTENLYQGLMYFDTTLLKPIWCKYKTGTWIDSNGEIV